MDPIDELVDTQLAAGSRDGVWTPGVDSCAICKFAWHGLPKNGCPGGFAESNS